MWGTFKMSEAVADEHALDIPRFATLFDCFKVVERYRRLAGLSGPPPIEPLDAFLMQQVAAVYPREPEVIDLAADATGGASAALWAGHPAVGRVRVMPVDANNDGVAEAWRSRFADIVWALGIPPDACSLEDASPFAPAPVFKEEITVL